MNQTPVRWGILGAARIATEKVVPALQSSAGNTVTAIASRDPQRSADVAARLDIPAGYGSYDELLASPEVDAVYIPLPNHLHLPWTLAAADAGKHILCEKPLALSSADARRMVDHCETAGVLLMEAFMYRLHPLWTTALRLASSGRIGEARAVHAVFSYHNVDPDDIRNRPAMGGGALLDVGCYAVNLARRLFEAEPTAVSSAIRTDPRFGTDAMTSAVLDFDGRHAIFTCSTQLEANQRVEIMGTAGRIVIEIPFNIPPDQATRLHVFSGGNPPTDPAVTTVEIPALDPYGAQGDAFADAVRTGGPVPTPPTDAVANLAVIEAILGR